MMPDPARTGRSVPALLVAIGLLFALSLGAITLMLTQRIDTQAQSAAHAAHEQMLRAQQDRLFTATDDYAFWTEAVSLIKTGTDDEIYENLGSGAAEGLLFDAMFILSPEGSLLHAFDHDGRDPEGAGLDMARLAPFLAHLRDMAVADYPIITGSTAWADGMAYVAAARVTPYPDLPAEPLALPILVTLHHYGEALYGDLSMATGATGFDIRGTAPAPADTAIPLPGPEGAPPSAWLTWEPRAPGTALRQTLALPLTAVALAMLALSVLAAWHFQRLGRHLQTAYRVASTDQLTGLLNRAGLEAVVQDAATRHRIDAGAFAVLTLDINAFKALNDSRGHLAGDIVLQAVADRVRSAIGQSGNAARMGGDEFLCLILDPVPHQAARSIASDIEARMHAPITLGEEKVHVEVAIGVAIGAKGLPWEQVRAQSDAAMYCAKRRADPTQPAVFTASMKVPAA